MGIREQILELKKQEGRKKSKAEGKAEGSLEQQMCFCFIYRKKQWLYHEHDPFETMNRYDAIAAGSVGKKSKE